MRLTPAEIKNRACSSIEPVLALAHAFLVHFLRRRRFFFKFGCNGRVWGAPFFMRGSKAGTERDVAFLRAAKTTRSPSRIAVNHCPAAHRALPRTLGDWITGPARGNLRARNDRTPMIIRHVLSIHRPGTNELARDKFATLSDWGKAHERGVSNDRVAKATRRPLAPQPLTAGSVRGRRGK